MILHDEQALKNFDERGGKFTDIVVLVDDNSSIEKIQSSSPIALFKKTLEQFDFAADYKRITVLKGGFKEWSSRYPDFVCGPHQQIFSIKSVSKKCFYCISVYIYFTDI